MLLVGTDQQLKKTDLSKPVNVAGCPIIPSKEIKNLGVVLDQKLSFDSHVDKVCKAAYFHIRALQHIRRSLPQDIVRTVACSIVGSRLDYCNAVLFGVKLSNIAKLQRVQNTLARVISYKSKYDHITPVLSDLHWLPIRKRIEHKMATIIYKVRLHHEPSYLATMLTDKGPERNLRSSRLELLAAPSVRQKRTVISSRSFSNAAPSIWNNIPLNIRNSDNIDSFKRNLKTYLFNLESNLSDSVFCN